MLRFITLLFLAFLILPLYPVFDVSAQMGLPGAAGDQMDDELGIDEAMEDEAAAAEKAKVDKPIPPIKMVLVRGGCFMMGDFTGEGDDDERPAHEVCVGDYYIQESEVTQELFEAVMGFNSVKTDPDPKKPVGHISWHWAGRFIKKLNEKTNGFYRLPTEAEWEYAARERGMNKRWSGTDDVTRLQDYAWFEDTSRGDVEQVKQKKPNALGLYDMSGNVWEWVEDQFDFDYYQVSPKDDPFGPDMSYWRVIRGGSVAENPHKSRTTYRYAFNPSLHIRTLGLRLAE